MRADAHYVDLLTSRRSEPSRESQRAGQRSKPAGGWDEELVDFPAESRDVQRTIPLSHLADDLTTIQSAAAMLANDTSPLVRRVSLDLINMHAARAAWRLRAEAVLSGSHRLDPRGRRLGALLTQVRDVLAPACRLSGAGLDVHASSWDAVVSIDSDVLEVGLIGAVVATLGLVRSDEWAAVRIHAVEHDGELATIDIAQEEVRLPDGLGRRFFDPAYLDRPGGWAACLGAAAAKTAAKLHGGDATLVTHERRGSTIRLTF
ncbi:MAG TPA: hypothetical protein VJN96_26045 [Vicinamibacterales bacterium]|nr:hypothetical protein [Vicinamibacterales bacterium]